jgi:hypothetical protein
MLAFWQNTHLIENRMRHEISTFWHQYYEAIMLGLFIVALIGMYISFFSQSRKRASLKEHQKILDVMNSKLDRFHPFSTMSCEMILYIRDLPAQHREMLHETLKRHLWMEIKMLSSDGNIQGMKNALRNALGLKLAQHDSDLGLFIVLFIKDRIEAHQKEIAEAHQDAHIIAGPLSLMEIMDDLFGRWEEDHHKQYLIFPKEGDLTLSGLWIECEESLSDALFKTLQRLIHHRDIHIAMVITSSFKKVSPYRNIAKRIDTDFLWELFKYLNGHLHTIDTVDQEDLVDVSASDIRSLSTEMLKILKEKNEFVFAHN